MSAVRRPVEPGARGEAVLIAAIAVGVATEGGRTPYRLAYARLASSGHSVGLMQTDFGQNPALAEGYVDAVLRDARVRGVEFSAAERKDILAKIVTRGERWVDVPARFRSAANAFGESSQGAHWIHDNLDSRFLRIAVKQIERFEKAIDARGITLDADTRTETLAMVAKLANQGGVGRVSQLVQSVEKDSFNAIQKGSLANTFPYPVPENVPPSALSSAWIAGFARAVEQDGVSSVLAKGVERAQVAGRLYAKIGNTPGAKEVLATAESRYDISDLTPSAFRERADLAALKKWVTTGRITPAEIAVAAAGQEEPSGVAGPSLLAAASPRRATTAPPDAVVGRRNEAGSRDFDELVEGTGRITSHSGQRPAPLKGASTLHQGVDIAAPEGRDIYAAAPGRVIRNFFDRKGGGNIVTIEHYDPNGRVTGYTQYMHMQSRSPLNAGDWVDRGQPIGKVGRTGLATGAHLHYEEWTATPGARPLAGDGNPSPPRSFKSQAALVRPELDVLGFALTRDERAQKERLIREGMSESAALRALPGSSVESARAALETGPLAGRDGAAAQALARMNWRLDTAGILEQGGTRPRAPEPLVEPAPARVRAAVVGMNIVGSVTAVKDGIAIVQIGATSFVSVETSRLSSVPAPGESVRISTTREGAFAVEPATSDPRFGMAPGQSTSPGAVDFPNPGRMDRGR